MPAPRDLAQTLSVQFVYTAWVFTKTLDGITHEESLTQPAPAGNCLNWVAGHVVATRMGILELLGEAPTWDDRWRERYRRGSDAVRDAGDAAGIAEIVRAFRVAQDPLMKALPGLTPDRLDAPAPFSPGDDPDETVGSLLATLVFHESYHCGQLGILRRLLGKDAIIK